ncbi:MAG: LPS export ABC transporter periplasmic protein LptC [Bacteroidales bacterium]|nr:LPS export ABC transporter periplasmic protein LptC [Bacteroidales bacterium]
MKQALYKHSIRVAVAFAAAILLFSCKEPEQVTFDFERVPVQVVHDMQVLQTDKGSAEMRMHAPLMQRFNFVKDSVEQSYELYSDGFFVDMYTEDGQLETTVTANQARHVTTEGSESWSAFGDVVIINHIKGEKVETDTIYWNKAEQQIYTDCYVKLTSDSGLLQGFGMTSDDRARNSVILRPFDWYAVERDSTYHFVDTVNAMGPQRK